MELLKKNEKEANLIVAKVMRVSFLIFTLVYILNVIGIFEVKPNVMTFAYISGGILLLVPTLLSNILKIDHWIIKFINVFCAAIFITLLSITLTWHVVAMYVYPIAIASLYFSKKLNITATILTVIGVSIGQVLAYFMQTTLDDNFTDVHGMIIFGVVPRAMVVIAVAAIFTMLCGRTASLLSNLMGAEEQKELFDRMKVMKDNATQTSEVLYRAVGQLSEISESSLRANQSIAEEAERLLSGSMENTGAVEYADDRIQDISAQLSELSDMNHRTAQLTDHIGQNTRENQRLMDEVTENMEQINVSTEECGQIIHTLGEESKEIIGIVQTITGISSKTNILALNASIEAARAGEQGKGFAVVAEEIRNLSMGTQNSSNSIMEALKLLEETSDKMTESITTILGLISQNLEIMQNVNASVETIADDSKVLGDEIQVVDAAMKKVEDSNKNMVENMQQVQEIMVEMTESVIDSESTTVTMMSKYEETARNITDIETVVGKLVEELGAGGFMSTQDITSGMSIEINESGKKDKLKTVISYVAENKLMIDATAQTDAFLGDTRKKEYDISVVVNNALYIWNKVAINKKEVSGNVSYIIVVESNPRVMNRRKHPRLPMTNACEILIDSTNTAYKGKLVNISAGGYAFSCTAEEFANAVGEKIQLTIQNFPVTGDKPLAGVIIRSTNDNGVYIVGCRMPEDNKAIQKYVEEKMKK